MEITFLAAGFLFGGIYGFALGSRLQEEIYEEEKQQREFEEDLERFLTPDENGRVRVIVPRAWRADNELI